MTKVAKALKYLLAHPEATPYQAALHAKLPPTTLYARLKRDKAKVDGSCPCCGQKLP